MSKRHLEPERVQVNMREDFQEDVQESTRKFPIIFSKSFSNDYNMYKIQIASEADFSSAEIRYLFPQIKTRKRRKNEQHIDKRISNYCVV